MKNQNCIEMIKNGCRSCNELILSDGEYNDISIKIKPDTIIKMKQLFAIELKESIKQKCEEINHYVSGCDSPFSYLQIADVQECLCEIEEILGIDVRREQ